jgi:hypothetical protein
LKFILEKTFKKRLEKRFSGWEFELGVLDDKPHKMAVGPQGFNDDPPTKNFAGGPARLISNEQSGFTTAQIFIMNQERIGTDLLTAPFKSKSSKDLIKFSREFLKLSFARAQPKRAINLLQAVIRNPILKQSYGVNELTTAGLKGFNRHLIDTGQMFKALKSRITKRPKDV